MSAWRGRIGAVVSVCVNAQAAVLLRIGLRYLCDSSGFPSYRDLFADVIGCFLCGLMASQYDRMRRSSDVAVRDLATGLRVGLWETLASFASWQQTASLSLVGWTTPPSPSPSLYLPPSLPSPSSPGPLDDVMACFAYLIQGLAVAFGSFWFGETVASFLSLSDPESSQSERERERERGREVEKLIGDEEISPSHSHSLLSLLLLLGSLFSLNAIAIPLFYYYSLFFPLLSLAFVIPAAFLRYLLSSLNSPPPHYPYGILLYNTASALSLSAIAVYTQQKECFIFSRDGDFLLQLTQAFSVGFSSSLSSLSSLVFASIFMERKRAVSFCALSVVLVQMALLATNGGYRWAWEGEWVVYCDLS